MNDNAKKILSIVVPTRNRADYACSAIRGILKINDPRIELVVQDNSSSDRLGLWIEQNIQDNRLRYSRIESPLSFIENFNAALALAQGEYVCVVGDDDCVSPEIVTAVEWGKALEVDAIVVKSNVEYMWPDTASASTLFTDLTDGVLFIREENWGAGRVDVECELRAHFKNGGVYFLDRNLPKLYHGIVHRSCLNAIRDRTGRYLGGLSPDAYASIAISCVAKKVVYISYPLTIPGACRVSGSVIEGLTKKHSRCLENAPHFRYRGPYTWSALVPPIYTVETIWADSGQAALDDMKRKDLVSLCNQKRLIAYCLVQNPDAIGLLWHSCMRVAKSRGENLMCFFPILFLYLIHAAIDRYRGRVCNRLFIMLGIRRMRTIKSVPDVESAQDRLMCYLSARRISLGNYLRSL